MRQGSVLSTDCYKIFINDLFKLLENSGAGATDGTVCSVYIGAPDDVLLAANCMSDLQYTLHVVANYAAEHRYIINSDKSKVLIYNSKTLTQVWKDAKPFMLGKEALEITEDYTHLGILSSTMKGHEQLTDESIKLARRTTYGLMGAGLHGNSGINPLVSAKLITTFIIPRHVHGLETVVIRSSDFTKLEKYHKILLRRMQHLPDSSK